VRSGRTRRARWALSLQPPPTLKATAHAHRRCTDRYPHCSERSLHLGRDACRMLHAAWLYVSCNVHVALVAGCLCATNSAACRVPVVCASNSAARLQNATQVQSDTAVLVPGLVGSKVRENSIDSSTHFAAVASQNRHAAVCAACIATDSLCAHNRTAPHRTARRCTARRCTAGYRGRVVLSTQRSDRTRVRWQFQWRRHSQSRVRVADSLGTARALHCAALHCSLNSPQCKLTSASLTCGTATLGVGTSRHSSGTPTAKPPSTCRRQSHSAGKSVIRQ
jgi:hypothetical protein